MINTGCEVEIPIKPCGPFEQDPTFEVVRSTLSPTWIAEQCKCGTEVDMQNMDNVSFHNDRFELVVNLKGYAPQEIRCTITCETVELCAQHGDTNQSETGSIHHNTSMTRNYELPQQIDPSKAICCLSSDGILLITAPWVS